MFIYLLSQLSPWILIFSYVFPRHRFCFSRGQASVLANFMASTTVSGKGGAGDQCMWSEWMKERMSESQVCDYSQEGLFPFSSVMVMVTSSWVPCRALTFFIDLKRSSWGSVQVSAYVRSTMCRLEEAESFWPIYLLSLPKMNACWFPALRKRPLTQSSFIDVR